MQCNVIWPRLLPTIDIKSHIVDCYRFFASALHIHALLSRAWLCVS